MKNVISKAYAKINLTLDVFPKRDDGYHELRSIMQTVSLHDRVIVSLESGRTEITSDALRAGIENDLCVRAAKQFLSVFLPDVKLGVDIQLEKNIPVSAGLGGGSSDAAAVIKCLAEEFRVTDRERLIDVCRSIGSDVPFFLDGGMALVEGTGEKLTPLPYRFDRQLLLVKPQQGTSAGEVYRTFDTLSAPSAYATDSVLLRMEQGVLPTDALSNTLQDAAIMVAPQSGEIVKQMYSLGAEKSLVSGSGSTVIGFFPESEIRQAAQVLSSYGFCERCQFIY